MRYFPFCLLLFWSSLSFAKPMKIDWLDLVPNHQQAKFNAKGMLDAEVQHFGDLAALQPYGGGIRQDLHNQKIKLAGFAVPLETEAKTVTEFLFAPYFGACIHVPPPPANQLIYVTMEKGIPMRELHDVVYLIGTLKTEPFDIDAIEIGYRLEGNRIEPYDGG